MALTSKAATLRRFVLGCTFGTASLAVLSASAGAAEPSLQGRCDLPGFGSGMEGWVRLPAFAYKVEEKRLPAGELIPQGEMLLYVTIKDAQKIYTTPDEIVVKDKNPLNSDFEVPAESQLAVVGLLQQLGTNVTLELVGTRTKSRMVVMPLQRNGMLCSVLIGKGLDGQLSKYGIPSVWQGAPLVESLREVEDPRRRTFTATLKKVEGAIGTIELTMLLDGRPVRTVTRGFDAVAGSVSISGLRLQLTKVNGGMRLDAITEPSDYRAWGSAMFGAN